MARKTAEKKQTVELFTPVGRVINSALFVKDQFNEKATPSYKIEMVFDPDELEEFEKALRDFAEDAFGDFDEDDLILPLLSGDKHARKREKRGKPGDAYKGKTIVRASTIFNKDGNDDVGGVAVFDENVEDIEPTGKGQVYNGCFGVMAVSPSAYTKEDEDSDGDEYERPAITLYLNAFQKTADGDRLASVRDYSKAFQPVKQRSERKSKKGGSKRRQEANED